MRQNVRTEILPSTHRKNVSPNRNILLDKGKKILYSFDSIIRIIKRDANDGKREHDNLYRQSIQVVVVPAERSRRLNIVPHIPSKKKTAAAEAFAVFFFDD